MQQGLTRVEQEIINYIRNNPGSSKADIIRHMRDKQLASRITVFEYIKDLETKNMIYGRKERPNSQSYMMYINEKSELATILGELEEFEKAYFNLLEKSKQIINNKDYSADAKALGIKETDPAKWSVEDKLRYLISKTEIGKKNEDEEEKVKKRLTSLLDRAPLTKTELRRRNISTDNGDMYYDKSSAIKIKPLVDDLIRIRYNIKNYEIIHLIFNSVSLFWAFTDILFLRSTFVWSNSISNKETLSQIYFNVYRKVSEIQTLLSEFLTATMLGIWTQTEVIGLIAKSFIKTSRDPNMYLAFVDSYQVLGMQSEIRVVIDSLAKLSKEINDYYRLDPNEIFWIDNFQNYAKVLTEGIKQMEAEEELEEKERRS